MASRPISKALAALLCFATMSVACAADLVDVVAARTGVDRLLLRSLIIEESRGHPWTLNVDGEPFYMPTQADAVKLIQHVQSHRYLLRATLAGERTQKRWFFDAKQSAVAWARLNLGGANYSIRRIDPRNIDIGLMQVSLRWHAKQMPSLAQALDPAWNVQYGAKYLQGLIRKHRDVVTAIGYYNANDPQKRLVYTRKILSRYEQLVARHPSSRNNS